MIITIHPTGNVHVKDTRDGQVWRSSIQWGDTEEKKDRGYAEKILGPDYEALIIEAGGAE